MFSNPPDLQYQKIIDIKHPAEVRSHKSKYNKVHMLFVAEYFKSFFYLFLKSVKNRVITISNIRFLGFIKLLKKSFLNKIVVNLYGELNLMCTSKKSKCRRTKLALIAGYIAVSA